MAARNKTIEAEQVLVRHVVEAKRDNITHVGPSLRAPFPSFTSVNYDGSQNTSILGYPLGRCMIAARFANQRWAALFSNAATAAELFEANASNPKLEVAWLGYRQEAGWFFELRGAGKPVVEFAQAADAGSPSTCKLVGLEPNLLKSGEPGEQAVARLCQHFEIPRPMPAIRMLDDGFQIIGASGRPVTSGLRGYVRLDGEAIREGDTEAAVALAQAIAGCDAERIREAVKQGAKRWETFEKVCNAVRPKLASADTTDEDVDDYAQVLLLFVSNYRDRPLPKAAALEQAVQKRRARRPRLLLDVCRATAAGREADLEQALRSSLEYFLKLRPEERLIRNSGTNKPIQYVALPESLFHLAALNRGLKLSPLPQHLADLLITPKSIGTSRK